MTTTYQTKDSGAREEYGSGMRRDVQTDKPRFDLIVPKGLPYEDQLLTRFAGLMARGAEKYCLPSDVPLDKVKEVCTCGQHLAIHIGLTTLVDSAEAVTRRIFEHVIASTQSVNSPTRESGPAETAIGKLQPIWRTALVAVTAASIKPDSADGPFGDFLRPLASDFWSRRVADAPSVGTDSASEARTWITTMLPDWREAFCVLGATRAWDSSEMRSRVFGEHSSTCLIHQLASTSNGFQRSNARNWERANGPEELERFKGSAFRHFMQWLCGETDEDHAAAVLFNVTAYETTVAKLATTPEPDDRAVLLYGEAYLIPERVYETFPHLHNKQHGIEKCLKRKVGDLCPDRHDLPDL